MHAHPTTAGHESHDLVGRHRGAAPRQPHQHVVQPFDVDPHLARVPARSSGLDRDRRDLIIPVRCQHLGHPTNQRPGRHVVLAHRRVQSVGLVVVHRGSQRGQLGSVEHLADGQPGPPEFTGEFLMTGVDGLGASLLGVPVLDLA